MMKTFNNCLTHNFFKSPVYKIGLLCIVLLKALSVGYAHESEADSTQIKIDAIENALKYQTGTIEFNSVGAKLEVPKGFKYLDADQARYVLSDLWGNPVDSSVLGLLVPENRGVLADNSWVFQINFDEIGYVKDDDAEDINYDDLLKDLQKETDEGNLDRVAKGYASIQLIGWASKPYYDKDKKVLHWAKELKFGEDSTNTLNYNLRILGRKGVFVFNAIATMSEMNEVKPEINKVITSIAFEKGSSYFDFNPDIDDVAAWTIGGLVAGKVLAKVGFFVLLAKFWKVIAIAFVSGGAYLWKFLTGKNRE